MFKFLFLLLLPVFSIAQPLTQSELDRCRSRAKNVEIIRDKWGIPHVYGKTDADAVFGLIYAQCEDDFSRVEMNHIEKLGRLSEVNGKEDIWKDLYVRMIIDSAEAVADYKKSPAWMKLLLEAWADGINYFLHRNPNVKPALLNRFKAWYPLLWTDGSIGAINTGNLGPGDLKAFYTGEKTSVSFLDGQAEKEILGSNGFAIGPTRSASGNALLYINPHTTFYFRPEVQMVSEEGLNAYGAVTWGQFFIYQGFNAHCGWMHTSSNADVSDVYSEKITKQGDQYFYTYEGKLLPVKQKQIVISYLQNGKLSKEIFKANYTHHGPVLAKELDGDWLSVRSYNRSLNSLIQSWSRTKAKGFEEYKKVMSLAGNTSNNTVFADNKGNIAYWHGNYMPIRDTSFNWGEAVDGTTSKTEWRGLHKVEETVHLYNPRNGWIQNCNSTPFSAAGNLSPEKTKYPGYMAPDGENFRGVNAVRILDRLSEVTVDKLISAGYDTYLPAFEVLVPELIKMFERDVPVGNMLYNEISGAVTMLKEWDYRFSERSIATTLAIEWGQKLNPLIQRVYIEQGQSDQVAVTKFFAANASQQDLLLPLRAVVLELKEKFGTWQIPWGDINRYQRLTGNVKETYDDARPSLSVGFTAATWGCLPSFVSRVMPLTKKRYGYSGNSFICAVEFGQKIKAKSLLAGGVSKDPASPHFGDQADMYSKGRFKDVLFYREDVLKQAEKRYRPGE